AREPDPWRRGAGPRDPGGGVGLRDRAAVERAAGDVGRVREGGRAGAGVPRRGGFVRAPDGRLVHARVAALPARAGRAVRRGTPRRAGRAVPAHGDGQQRDPVRVAARRDPQPLRAGVPGAGPVPRLAGAPQVPTPVVRGPRRDRLGPADRGGHLPPRAAGLPPGLAGHDRRGAGGAGVGVARQRCGVQVAARGGPVAAIYAAAGPLDIFLAGRRVPITTRASEPWATT